MHYTTLGKTGLKVSVAGLGCGGNSRIGLGTGLTEAQSIALVREALDLGVNFLDTAAAYETEGIVGKAIKGRPRDSVVISTKSHATSGRARARQSRQFAAPARHRLRRHLPPARPGSGAYDTAMAEIVPALLREKEKGKFRHLAVSETGPRDPEHTMLARAVEERSWEVFMLGFSMMHQNARKRLLPRTREKGVGTLCMFAVRNIFSKPEVLKKTFAELAAEGKVPASLAAGDNPLGSSCTRAERRAWSTPPTAMPATSPASTSCCSAPATPPTCAPTSPRSCARRSPPPTCRSCTTCSAAWWASASTCRTASGTREVGWVEAGAGQTQR